MGAFLTRFLAVWCALIIVGCQRETMVFNDCVIFAANAKAVKDAKEALNPLYRSNILLVHVKDGPVGHAWFIFALGATLCAYDSTGTRALTLPVDDFEKYPQGIALQLVGQNLAVAKFAFTPKP